MSVADLFKEQAACCGRRCAWAVPTAPSRWCQVFNMMAYSAASFTWSVRTLPTERQSWSRFWCSINTGQRLTGPQSHDLPKGHADLKPNTGRLPNSVTRMPDATISHYLKRNEIVATVQR